jgi:hypothetical protein
MAISFNTSAGNTAVTAASVAVTIPSGVLTGDVMVMSLSVFCETSTAPTIAFSGAGGSWTLMTMTDSSANPQQAADAGSGIWQYVYAYWRVATSGDPGASLTITETGSPAGTTWMSVVLAAYTGASTSAQPDVSGGAESFNATSNPVTCPSETTGASGDWAVFLAGFGIGGGNTVTVPSGSTSRQNVLSGANTGAALSDSDASVGPAGTSIGGGTFTTGPSSSDVWWGAFTVGLQPPAAPSGPAAAPNRQLPNMPAYQVFTAGPAGGGHSF